MTSQRLNQESSSLVNLEISRWSITLWILYVDRHNFQRTSYPCALKLLFGGAVERSGELHLDNKLNSTMELSILENNQVVV